MWGGGRSVVGEGADGDAERAGEAPQGVKPRTLVAVLDLADGLLVETDTLSKCLLGKAGGPPLLAQTIADASPVRDQLGGVVVHPPTLAYP